VANLVPPFGQFQNGHRVKGWLVGAAGVTAIAANIGTFVALKQICEGDSTCPGHTGTARALRVTNIVAGVAAIGLYLYGVADGFVYYRPTVKIIPSGGGALAGVDLAF
jgi:hypothetical protein